MSHKRKAARGGERPHDDDPRGQSEDTTNYVAEAIDAVLAGKEVDTPRTKSYGCGVKYASGRSGS